MSSKPVSLRIPDHLLGRIDVMAAQSGLPRTDVILDLLIAALDGKGPSPIEPPRPRPRPAPTAGASPAPARKVDAAKMALAGAEARTGVRSVMDDLPLGNTRPPMQRARDLKGR